MFIYNHAISRILLDNLLINYSTYMAFGLVIYLFCHVQDSLLSRRQLKQGQFIDLINITRCSEHLFYVHWTMIALVYTNNWIYSGCGFIKLNSASTAIANVLYVFFLLAILNIGNHYILPMSKMRINVIIASYYLTISFMLCNNLVLFFILLEIYSILFFLYLIGFNHSLQEVLYYLQHDLTVYVFFGLVSTLFFILGIFFIIYDFGVYALNFDVLKLALESYYIYVGFENNMVVCRGVILILLSLFVKVGLAPFQGWTVRFLKRTCYHSLIFMLLISKLVLIFGAFFTILPIFVNITPILKFIGLSGLLSYIVGSYLVYLRHAEIDKLLAFVNLTSSGFFFMIFFINNPQNYNFAFTYFSTFMVLLNFTLLLFFSPELNWISRRSVNYIALTTFRDYQRHFNVVNGSIFTMFNRFTSNGIFDSNKHEICRVLLLGVLASLPPTITFYCKVLYDFSFFNSIVDLSTPYGFFLIIGMLTYISTVYGFLGIWRRIYISRGHLLTYHLIKRQLGVISINIYNLSFTRIFARFTFTIFYVCGFAFGYFEIF